MTINSSEIGIRFAAIATDAFNFSFSDYSKSNNGRVLYGLLIDIERNRLEDLFGNPPLALIDAVNSKPILDCKAGYRVDVGKVFPQANVNADVLLLSKDALAYPDRTLEALMFHECCHLIIDSNSIGKLEHFDPKASYHGEKLYKRTDTENEHITKHSPEFCRLLAGGAERLCLARPDTFRDRWDVINEAMRFDLRT
ncbi:MAG: hypothetical protein ACK41V_13355 [Acidovorax sp.]|uniref:hypothetical protein n=1 Tax=Acidovorax sp. TaxID=1872122 RepID=UPI00391AD41A